MSDYPRCPAGRPRAAAPAILILSAAIAAASPPALAADDLQSDPIIVTARLDSRALRDLQTAAFGIGIDEEQLAAINAANAEDAIRYAPSLTLRKRYSGDANATLSFRAMHTQQTPRALVMVDGFTISNFLGASFFTAPKWAVLAPDDIGRAEIVYGPTSARYSGHSMGGTLLVATRPIAESGARLNVQGFGQRYRYYDTDEDLFGWAVDAGYDLALGTRGGLSFGYRHFENEGQPQEWRMVGAGTPYADQAIIDPELPFLRIAAQDSMVSTREDQFRLRGHYAIGDGWELRGLAALLVDREAALDPRSFLVDEAGRETFAGISGVAMRLAESTELLAGIGLSGEAAGWALDLSLSRFATLDASERSSDNFDLATGARPVTGRLSISDGWWNSVEASAQRRLGAHSLAFGLSHARYSDANETFDSADWRHAGVTALRDASGGDTRLLGVFVEDAIAFAPRLTATLGLRYEDWRASNGFLTDAGATVSYASRREHAWSPRAALTFRPDAVTELSASAALATRFPTVRELYQAGLIAYGPDRGGLDLNGFNPDLAPEKAADFQLTATRRFGNAKLTLNAWRQDVRDTIFTQSIAIPDPGTGDLVQSSLATNIGKVRSKGVDLVLTAEDVLIPGLALDANLSWTDARITRNALNPSLVGNRFPRVPEWRANASLRYSPDERWMLAANLRHQDTPHRNLENDATSRCGTFYCVSSFAFVDLRVRRSFGAFEVALGVDNLLDEKAFVYHPYPGRSVLLDLRWKVGRP